jgi:Astacin (Peptidase family M12A)
VESSDDYDFQSIMHYFNTAFALDSSLPTIEGIHGELLDTSPSPTMLDTQFVNQKYQSFRGIVRRSDSGVDAAGHFNQVAVAPVDVNFVVTAVRTTADKLKVIV